MADVRVPEAMIEGAARAMYAEWAGAGAPGRAPGGWRAWEDLDRFRQDIYRSMARAALAASREAVGEADRG